MEHQYPKEATVQLFKTVVGKTGNIYYPGVYSSANPLPERFMTPEYVKLLTVVEPKVRFEEKTMLHKNEPAVEEFEIKVEQVIEPAPKPLNINEATKAEIVALNGVGSKTADKVIELRELFPFGDYQDLNERAPLTFGRDWKEFNLDF